MIMFRPDPRDRKLVIGMDEKGMNMFHESMKEAAKKYHPTIKKLKDGTKV